MNRKEIAKKFAAMLLAMKALKINVLTPYTWASGWRSPVYCNNRLILGSPEDRSITKELLAELIREKYGDQKIILAGVATGAIGIGALVADMLKVPFVYVRPEAKQHGLGTQIEGMELTTGHKIVVIEDLISTGKSSLKIVDAIRATGAEVLGMAALFTYGFPVAIEAFAQAGVQLDTLSDYEVLTEVVEERNLIAADQKETLADWRRAPEKWMQEA